MHPYTGLEQDPLETLNVSIEPYLVVEWQDDP